MSRKLDRCWRLSFFALYLLHSVASFFSCMHRSSKPSPSKYYMYKQAQTNYNYISLQCTKTAYTHIPLMLWCCMLGVKNSIDMAENHITKILKDWSKETFGAAGLTVMLSRLHKLTMAVIGQNDLVTTRLTAVCEVTGLNHTAGRCVHHNSHTGIQPLAYAALQCLGNSAFYPLWTVKLVSAYGLYNNNNMPIIYVHSRSLRQTQLKPVGLV